MPGNPSGRDLIKLLKKDGWQEGGHRTHGGFFPKQFPDERIPCSTVIPDTSEPLPDGTLGAILGVKRTGLGKNGLKELIARHR